MSTFTERERYCNATFQSGGPYWHAYTSGKETSLAFACGEDFTFVMNLVAQAAALFPNVTIIAFEVMGNHFHFVVSAEGDLVRRFWEYIRKRLARSFPSMKGVVLALKPITDLQSLRNNIVYSNRNGYVADPAYTPFSYPWGTGKYYFLDWPEGIRLCEVSARDKRKIFRCRTPEVPGEWTIAKGHVSPASYCAVNFGMSMFRDAHHYFAMVSKNVEEYVSLAAELDDGEFLTDPELFVRLRSLVREDYGVSSLRDLTKPQKLDIARRLRREFRSSNGPDPPCAWPHSVRGQYFVSAHRGELISSTKRDVSVEKPPDSRALSTDNRFSVAALQFIAVSDPLATKNIHPPNPRQFFRF